MSEGVELEKAMLSELSSFLQVENNAMAASATHNVEKRFDIVILHINFKNTAKLSKLPLISQSGGAKRTDFGNNYCVHTD